MNKHCIIFLLPLLAVITACSHLHQAGNTLSSSLDSLLTPVLGSPIKPISIPADALQTRPASLNQLLRKVGRLAARDNREVEIRALPKDLNYLQRGVAKGASEAGKQIRVIALRTDNRNNTRIVLR